MRLRFWQIMFTALDVTWYAVDRARNYAYAQIWSSPEWQKQFDEQTRRELRELGLIDEKQPPKRI